MLEYLSNWKGTITVNGTEYATVADASKIDFKSFSDDIHIILHSKSKNQSESDLNANKSEIRITVRAYMTKKSTPEFDFMAKWNNDVPMPLRTMVGTVEKETKGMVYMKLHGDIYANRILTCMKCGKPITNPISQYFGMGPECGRHNYVNPFNSEEELHDAVAAYKKQLQNITWEGWVIKSSILEREEI